MGSNPSLIYLQLWTFLEQILDMFPILRKRSKKLKERTSGSLVASRSSDLPAALSPGSSKKPVPLVHRSVRGLPISSPIPSPDSKRRNTSSPSSSGEYLSLFQDIRDEYSDATSASSHNPRGLLFTGMGVEDQRYDPPEGVRTDRESDEEECRPFPSPYRQYNVMSPINIPSLPDTESEYLSMEPCQSSYGSRSRESNQEKRSRQILQDISAAFRDSCHSASLDPSSDANARPKPTPKRTTGTSARGGYGILRWRDDNCEDLGVERLYVDIETPQGKKAIPIAYPPEFEHPFSAELENKLSHTGKSSPLLVHVSRARQTSSKPRKTLARISPRDNDLELYRKELDFLATVPSSPSRIAIRPIGIVPPSKRQILLGCSDLPDELNWEVIQRNHIRINLRETKKKWFAGSVLGEGTFGRVYLTYNVPNRLELAMKIVYIKRPLPKIVCQGLVNELKVLERLSRRDPEEVAPFVMIPNMVTGLWSWQSSEGFLHIITVSLQS